MENGALIYELFAALRKFEFSHVERGHGEYRENLCPSCVCHYPFQHNDGCELADILHRTHDVLQKGMDPRREYPSLNLSMINGVAVAAPRGTYRMTMADLLHAYGDDEVIGGWAVSAPEGAHLEITLPRPTGKYLIIDQYDPTLRVARGKWVDADEFSRRFPELLPAPAHSASSR